VVKIRVHIKNLEVVPEQVYQRFLSFTTITAWQTRYRNDSFLLPILLLLLGVTRGESPCGLPFPWSSAAAAIPADPCPTGDTG